MSTVAQRKNKRFLVVNATNATLYTTAQLYGALTPASGLSAPVQFLGGSPVAPNGVVTENNLGSVAVFANDTDLGLFLTKATTGLLALTPVSTTAGEVLRDLGRKIRIGTTNFSDLVTFTQVQRIGAGTTATDGIKQQASTVTDQQLVYSVYWVVSDVFANQVSGSVFYNSGAANLVVGVVPVA